MFHRIIFLLKQVNRKLAKLARQKINIFGPKDSGKTHLANILKKKIDSSIYEASDIKKLNFENLNFKKCIIIDNYNNNIDEKLFYSLLKRNQSTKQICFDKFSKTY